MGVGVLSKLSDSVRHITSNYKSYIINLFIYVVLLGLISFGILFGMNVIAKSNTGAVACCLIPLGYLILILADIWLLIVLLVYIKRANKDPRVSIIDTIKDYLTVDFLKGKFVRYIINALVLYLVIAIIFTIIMLVVMFILGSIFGIGMSHYSSQTSNPMEAFAMFTGAMALYLIVTIIVSLIISVFIIPWTYLGLFAIIDDKSLSEALGFWRFSFSVDGFLSGLLSVIYSIVVTIIILVIFVLIGLVIKNPLVVLVISAIIYILAMPLFVALLDYFYRIYGDVIKKKAKRKA